MTRVFRWCFSVLIFSMSLSACVRTVTPSSLPKELPFTDADIDVATVLRVSPQTLSDIQELDDASEATELPPMEYEENQGEITSAAVLPGATGIGYFFERPLSVNGTFSAYLFDHEANQSILLYTGSREIQSLAGSVDGKVIVLSLRETSSTSSDYEIYRLDVDTGQVFQLTNNNSSDTNVSLSANGLVTAWQGPNPAAALGSKIYIHSYHDSSLTSATLTVLTSSVLQTMPSLSSNGNYVVFVRELANLNRSIVRYQRSLKTYTTLVNLGSILVTDPSISDDGGKVLWREDYFANDIVRLRDRTSNTTRIVLRNVGNISHPFLTSDGLYFTYNAVGLNGSLAVFTKSLATGTVAQNTSPPNGTLHNGATWVLPTRGGLQINFSGLPGPWARPGQGYVTITGPNGFEEEMFTEDLLTNLEPGTYTVTTNPLSVCNSYYGIAPKQLIEVNYNETSTAFVDYAISNFLMAPQFRAKVQGAYSDGLSVVGETEVLPKNNQLYVFGCLQSRPADPLEIVNANIYEGNVRDYFVETEIPLITHLQFNRTFCPANTDSTAAWGCIRYIYGAPILTSVQMSEFKAGNTYVWINESQNIIHDLLSQLPFDSPKGRGGNLKVIVSKAGLPLELRDSTKVCLDGRFRQQIRGGVSSKEQNCIDSFSVGTPINNDKTSYFYGDIFSGSYDAYDDTLTANDGSTYSLVATPVEVRSGTTATLNVCYVRDPLTETCSN